MRFSVCRFATALAGAALFFGGAVLPRLSAQTVFSAVVFHQGQPTNALFQENNGIVSAIPTGLPTHNFPALSQNGRFITMASRNPAQPNNLATDLFIFDRATNQRRTLVDYSVEAVEGGFVTPEAAHSALSSNNQLLALHTVMNVTTGQSSSSNPMLTVHRVTDGFQLSIAAFGFGNALDFFRSEFTGLSWAPNRTVFAAPIYLPTVTQLGGLRQTVGIAEFALNTATTQWEPVRQLTQPRIFDNVFPEVMETHVYPAFSPVDDRLAYFELTWPDPLLAQPVSARLMVINLNGGAPQVLVNFNPGFFPMGLAWTADGSEVIYAVGPQLAVPGQFFPAGDPQGAAIRKVNSTNPTTILQVPGIDAGSFPGFPRTTFTPPGPVIDLSRVPVSFTRQPNGNFLLRASGLDPAAVYILESSENLSNFGNPQNFTGEQMMTGIDIPPFAPNLFFRFRAAP